MTIINPFPGRGGTPLQPQLFYIQDIVVTFGPFSQLDWPVPRGPDYPNQLRTLAQGPAPSEILGPFSQFDWPLYRPIDQLVRGFTVGPIRIIIPPPFNQFDWPLYKPQPLPGQTWLWQYNVNLIGKDQLPIGETLTALPPQLVDLQVRFWSARAQFAPINPFAQTNWPNPQILTPSAQWWAWNYNLNLIGQDKLPVGKDITDLPPQPFDKLIRTWNWSYSLNLIGQDRLPVGEFVTDLPAQPIYPVQLRTLVNAPAPVTVVVAGPWQVVYNQFNWPLPVAQYRIDQTLAVSYNLNLIGMDQFPPGENITGGQNATPVYIYGPEYPINLRPITQGPAPVVPAVGPWQSVYNQYSWPLTPAAPQPERSITASYNRNLIGQDKLPPGEVITALPAPATIRFDTWITSVSLALKLFVQRPFVQTDWPLTAAQQGDATLRTWLDRTRIQLIPIIQLPKNQYDWQNPRGPEYSVALRSLGQGPAPPPIIGPWRTVFNQFDWPLPNRGPAPIDQFIGYTSPFAPIPPPTIGAQYFLLQPHYVKDNWLPAWTVVTEGKEIPFGWIPTLMVDPLNQQAVNAFYAAGPRQGYQGPGFDWQGPQQLTAQRQASIQSPITFWVQSSPGMFKLTGLGAAFPPVGE